MTDLTWYDGWYDLQKMAAPLLASVVGFGAGYALRALIGRWQAGSIEKRAQTRFDAIELDVKNRLKEADIQARAEVVKAREDFEKTTKARRKELQDLEERLLVREENLDRKMELMEKKELAVNQRQEETQVKILNLTAQRQALDCATGEAQARLQKLESLISK